MFEIKYIYNLVDKMTPALKQIKGSLEQTKNAVKNSTVQMVKDFKETTAEVEKLAKKLRSIGADMTPISVGVGALGYKAVKTAGEFEMLQIQLNSLTGSAEMGARAFKEVVDYAAKTPYEVKDITKSLNMLMSTGGMNFDEAMKNIKVLGDIAAIGGGEMEGMALAFSQTAATTRLLGQDFNQFVNNSVPLMKILTDYTGRTSAEIMQMKTDGKLSFDIVAKAMEQATKAGGIFADGAKKMSLTIFGLFSTLKDQLSISLAVVGREIVSQTELQDVITKTTSVIEKLGNAFANLPSWVKKSIIYFGIIIALLGPFLLILGQMAIGIIALAKLFGMLSVATTALTVAFRGLMLILGVGATRFTAFGMAISAVVFYWKDIVEWVNKASNAVKNFFGGGGATGKNEINLNKSQEINSAIKLINNPTQLNAGGKLDINFNNPPSGTNMSFTPSKNNFMNIGTNTYFAT